MTGVGIGRDAEPARTAATRGAEEDTKSDGPVSSVPSEGGREAWGAAADPARRRWRSVEAGGRGSESTAGKTGVGLDEGRGSVTSKMPRRRLARLAGELAASGA